MNGALPGVSGSLFPSRYLADGLQADAGGLLDSIDVPGTASQLTAFWTRVERSCGPASGLRTLFDLVAMPLFSVLGFRASGVEFDRHAVRARLCTPTETAVGLIVLPWAQRPSTLWRGAADLSARIGARFCFVLAPPNLSLIAIDGQASRRSVEFTLPAALDPGSLRVFLALSCARTFDPHVSLPLAPLDTLLSAGHEFQDRVRADLQVGVERSLATLESVIARSPKTLAAGGRFDEALTLIYRILFLLFAESRDLVPRDHPIYRDAYAIGRLCRDILDGTISTGLWDALAAITRLSRRGCHVDDLIVRPFNGQLFAREAAPSLEAGRGSRRPTGVTTARDAAMKTTIVALATRHTGTGREDICYADLGVEQLGAVYERVLDLEPDRHGAHATTGADSAIQDHAPHFRIENRFTRFRSSPLRRHSDRRKQTGTFYTPQDLTEFVVRRTLAPLVSGRAPDQILALRVVDPAMGSGAFLVAACRYLASAYERALVEAGTCSEFDFDEHERANLRRIVAERCLAGVDLNPVAVQLARLSVWLATLAHGKPLGFLDHRLRTGNSLLGARPDDLQHVADGNRTARHGTLPLFDVNELADSMRAVTRPLSDLARRPDDTVADVRAKEAIWTALSGEASALARWRLALGLWCARWFWPRDLRAPSAPETRAALDAMLRHDRTLGRSDLARWVSVARSVSADLRFFHWPIEFPDVFYDDDGRPRDRPGFDAVVGNPPWEMLRNDDAVSRGLANPSWLRFIRESGLYTDCDRGHMNLYQPFLERALSIARRGGRVGLVLPWGLAADDGATSLRSRLLDRCATDTVVGFDNANGIFPIHRGLRFLVVVTSPGRPTVEIRSRFGVRTGREIAALADAADDRAAEASSYPIRLSPAIVNTVGGSARRLPDARRAADLPFLTRLTENHPRLGDAAGWGLRFGRELNMTEQREHFGPQGLPVVEGKHVRPFAADTTSASFRISRPAALRLMPSGSFDRPRLAYRDVSGVANRVSLIAAVLPGGAVTTHTVFCLRTVLTLDQQYFLCGIFNSYVLNAAVRLLMGGHVTTSLVEGLPAPAWTGSAAQQRIARLTRWLARVCSARGKSGRRRSADDDRLEFVKASLQAAVARLYGLDAVAFSDVLDSFPLVPAEERARALQSFNASGRPLSLSRRTSTASWPP
jgi:hypothetical protein